MADAQRFVVRERRGARMLLALVDSPRKRLLIALMVALLSEWPIARYAQYYQHRVFPSVLEETKSWVSLNRYLGRPDNPIYYPEVDYVDPVTIGASQPNLDRFYKTIAARVKSLVGDPRTEFELFVFWDEFARGWPFVCNAANFIVDVTESKRFDGRAPTNQTFRADEYGLSPVRPWGWWGNAAFGGILGGVIVYIILTLVAMGLQRSLRPVAGFPVIVPDQST